MNLTQSSIVIGALALWLLGLLIRDRFRLPSPSRPIVKFTHVLPAILQIVLFAYWAMYSSQLRAHSPVLGAQMALAYAFDFLLQWTMKQSYSPSFGPVPIVLSANLFVWFPNDFLLHALVIAVALSSKVLILAGGRHVFNPSVFALTVIGVLTIVFPERFRYQDVSHDFDRPPLMAWLILALALIPQIRLRTTPIALGAATTMLGAMVIVMSVTGYKGAPSPWWPAWLLTITLLAGDPATVPSTLVARLLSGVFLGTAFYVVSRVMLFTIETDTFSKIMPIPLMNLLVPQFERAGSRLAARWPRLSRTDNRTYLAIWVLISIVMLIV